MDANHLSGQIGSFGADGFVHNFSFENNIQYLINLSKEDPLVLTMPINSDCGNVGFFSPSPQWPLTNLDLLLLTAPVDDIIEIINSMDIKDKITLSKAPSLFYARNSQPIIFQYSRGACWLFNKFWNEHIWPVASLGEIIWFSSNNYLWLGDLIKSDYFQEILLGQYKSQIINDLAPLICKGCNYQLLEFIDPDLFYLLPSKNNLTFLDYAIYEENLPMIIKIAFDNPDKFKNFLLNRRLYLSDNYRRTMGFDNLNLEFVLQLSTPLAPSTINKIISSKNNISISLPTMSLIFNKDKSSRFLLDALGILNLDQDFLDKNLFLLNEYSCALYDNFLIGGATSSSGSSGRSKI